MRCSATSPRAREKDWLDIEGIALRRRAQLDTPLIWTELRPLLELKEAPEAGDRLRRILERALRS